MDLTVIIVTYDACDLTRACLSSVFEQSRRLAFEVIAVDNASTEPTAHMVREKFPDVRLIELKRNIGFARAVNLAASRARGSYFLLLNPDTVVHDAALERLLRFARAHPEHGIYGGRTLGADGSVDPSSCWGAPTLWSLFCFAAGLTTLFRHNRWLDPESLGRWPRDSVREVGVVTGCLCLVSRENWRRLGGFEPRYFMYGEDADLSMRARGLGMRPVITPDATVTHFVGKSTAVRADKQVMVLRAKITLIRRHFSGLRRFVAERMIAVGVALRALGSASWRDVWSRRAQWRAGYPEPHFEPFESY